MCIRSAGRLCARVRAETDAAAAPLFGRCGFFCPFSVSCTCHISPVSLFSPFPPPDLVVSPPQDPVVVVRRKTADGSRSPKSIDFPALLRPFTTDTWLLLGGSVAAVFIVAAFLAIWQPTPIYRRGRVRLRLLQWMSNLYVGPSVLRALPCALVEADEVDHEGVSDGDPVPWGTLRLVGCGWHSSRVRPRGSRERTCQETGN